MNNLTKTLFLGVIGVLGFTGCSNNNDVYDPAESAKENNPFDFTVSDSFDWNTLQKVDVTVVTDGKFTDKYGIEVYDADPLASSNANLLASGTATSSGSFTAKVEVGKAQTYIYALETTPEGARLVRCVEISNSTATVDFSAKAAATRAMNTPANNITWPSAPASSDYKTTVPDGTSSFSTYKDDKDNTGGVYTVDNTITSINAGKAQDLVLYITGNNVSLNYNNAADGATGRRTIYILPGAKLKLNYSTDFVGTTIYVAEGGTLEGSQISASKKGSKIYNAGTINVTAFLEANNDGLIYNQGTIESSKRVSVENPNSMIVNDGTITAETIETAGSGSFGNSGKVTVTDNTYLSSNNNTWVNDGQWTTQTFKYNGGSNNVINSCKLIVKGGMTMDLGSGDHGFINNAGSSVTVGGDLNMNNCSLTLLNNSIFKVTGSTTIRGGGNGYGVKINGTGADKALLLFHSLTFGWQSTALMGNLTVAYTSLETVNSQWQFYYTQEPTVNMTNDITNAGVHIPANGNCSEGYDPIVTPPDIKDGYSLGISHIYAMEDNWPDYGDYDLNDVVVKVDVKAVADQAAQPSGTAKVYKKLIITPTFMSTGAENTLGAYMQFDNIAASSVSSGSIESNQTKAVVTLTPDVKSLLGGNYINVGETSARNESNYKEGTKTTIELSTAVSQEDIEKGMNFFITVNGNDKGRKEIHLGGYSATNLAGSFTGKYFTGNNVYKAAGSNLVWGVCLPGAGYNWPVEKTPITTWTNGKFKNWCESNGTNDNDWYLNISAN